MIGCSGLTTEEIHLTSSPTGYNPSVPFATARCAATGAFVGGFEGEAVERA
jgi:hypothetical protein